MIAIKNMMEMPQSCMDCIACIVDDLETYCALKYEGDDCLKHDLYKSRADDCPLIEIKENEHE